MDLDELGSFLKSRRDRIRPGDVGLPVGPRRRVPGLRRDEVANLAGASTDYYIELERGTAQPSEQMLAALARALRLTHDERDHLYHLANRPIPPSGSAASHVHPGMLDLLERLQGTPAQVITDLHVTLVQNPLARALLGPPVTASGYRASFVHRWFTDPDARALYPPSRPRLPLAARSSPTCEPRSRGGAARDDEANADGRRPAQAVGPEFADVWARHDVAVRRDGSRSGSCTRIVGTIEVNCLNLFSEDGRQRLLWFTPAVGTTAIEQLELLGVIGVQSLEPEQVD